LTGECQMTSDEFADLIAFGAEQAHVEFKGPGNRSDGTLFRKVVRAVLAMSNRRDGGVVLIGVDDNRGAPVLTGLTEEDASSWRPDDVRDGFAAFADPSVNVDIIQVQHEGKVFVAIRVREFGDIPVICRRDSEGLQEGTIYVRSRRKPESIPIQRQGEMRDLIELATEKRLRSFLRTAGSVGLSNAAGINVTPEERFEVQANLALSVEPMEEAKKAMTRGHWQFVISPNEFEPERLSDISTLSSLVDKAKVESRGWLFPYISGNNRLHVGRDWVEQGVDTRIHVEGWRLYQSGLFVCVIGFWEDWYEQDRLFGPPPKGAPTPGSQLYAENVVGTLTNFYEFAARLSTGPTGGDYMRLQASVHGIRNRELRLDGSRVGFSSPRIASISEFPLKTIRVSKGELLGSAKEAALDAARDVLARFGWTSERDTLRSMQPLG
jgi:hypothetical protein